MSIRPNFSKNELLYTKLLCTFYGWLIVMAAGLATVEGQAQDAPLPQAAVQSLKQVPGPIRLLLPPKIYAVPGVEMNVYFDNVCVVINPANYVFDVTCAKGIQQVERWTFTPTDQDVGEFPFLLEVRNDVNKVIARAESTLKVVAKDAGAGRELSMLIVGDSLTGASRYPQQVVDLCKPQGNPKITLVGTTGPGGNCDGECRHEGYGGWTAHAFATRYTGIARMDGEVSPTKYKTHGSPFIYKNGGATAALDFPRYCKEYNNGKIPDVVTIFLGCNDNFGAKDKTIDASIDAMFKTYDILIDMIRQARKDTKTGIVLLVPPAATQDAFGANYQCGQTRWQYKRNQQRVVERMVEKYGNREAEFLYLIPANVNLDCVNNCITRKAPWNAATKAEGIRLNNGVHPATEGYRQIGDTIYCWLKAQVAAEPVPRAQTNATPAIFQGADTNSDGRVSQAEFAGHVKKSTFEKLDTNKDGMISPEEWKAVDLSPSAQKNFEAMDKDRNGMISYPEFSDVADWKSALNDSFKSLDRDRDSHLAPDELTGRPMFRLLSVNF